jgi:general secretion pathway protein G
MTKIIKKNKNQAGFTLIELLVVLAIIGVLAVLILTNLATARAKARDAQRKSDVKHLGDAVEMWAEDNGATYPDADGNAGTTSVLAIPTSVLQATVVADGKYIKKMPADPQTGKNYLYGSNGNDFEIWAKMEASANDQDWYVVTSGFSAIVTPPAARLGTPVWGDSGNGEAS